MGTSKTRESVFRFKRFDVANSLSAMKVGTDGVLLGAWACVPDASGATVLDVGTGSGLIALMLAQRFENAFITGIDIVEEACEEARVNAGASPWAGRIAIEHAGFASMPVRSEFRCRSEQSAIFQDGNQGSGPRTHACTPWCRPGLRNYNAGLRVRTVVGRRNIVDGVSGRAAE